MNPSTVATTAKNPVSTPVDQIVEELLRNDLSKDERMTLLRELVRRGEELPDDLLNVALRRLMERLAGN
ncbi:MAG: hypothetical protein IT458_18610 [Planctomycetes bacterium]|nr:hypothetical protein [Planctomycetota bacterium]